METRDDLLPGVAALRKAYRAIEIKIQVLRQIGADGVDLDPRSRILKLPFRQIGVCFRLRALCDDVQCSSYPPSLGITTVLNVVPSKSSVATAAPSLLFRALTCQSVGVIVVRANMRNGFK